jgi:hypothetical protein
VTPVPPAHWVDGPYPGCAEDGCGRRATHYYLDAPTGVWRYGCERHMRQRRADPAQVAYVLHRGAPPPARPDRPGT